MGIDSLNPLLREKCPEVFVRRPLTDFTGKRIAIDANNWSFRMMAIAHKRSVYNIDVVVEDLDRSTTINFWFQHVLDGLCKILTCGITPIMVFDGQCPDQKTQTRELRRKKKEDSLAKAQQLREQLCKTNVLDKNADTIEELRKIMSRCSYISHNEMDMLRNILMGIGIPCLMAKGEAEQLCSMLAIEGYVEAVMSADTDNLAYGCPIVIIDNAENVYDQDTKTRTSQVITVGIKDVLTGLGITFARFVDLCIMMGCDYNDNIPQIGGTRALKLINKFGSIDNIPRLLPTPNLIDADQCKCGLPKDRVYDVSVLKHIFCREQFNRKSSSMICINWGIKFDIENRLVETGRDILSSVGHAHYLLRLISLYSQIPISNISQPRLPVPLPRLVVMSTSS